MIELHKLPLTESDIIEVEITLETVFYRSTLARVRLVGRLGPSIRRRFTLTSRPLLLLACVLVMNLFGSFSNASSNSNSSLLRN